MNLLKGSSENTIRDQREVSYNRQDERVQVNTQRSFVTTTKKSAKSADSLQLQISEFYRSTFTSNKTK